MPTGRIIKQIHLLSFLRVFSDRFNKRAKAHLEFRWHHHMDCGPRLNEKENEYSEPAFSYLLLDCKCNVNVNAAVSSLGKISLL